MYKNSKYPRNSIVIILTILISMFGIYHILHWQLISQLQALRASPIVETKIVKAELPKYLAKSYDVLTSFDKRIDAIETKTIIQQNFSEQQFAGLYSLYSNSLTVFSIILTIWGLILGFSGIWLSIYMSKKYKEIQEAENTVERLKADIDNLLKGKNQTLFNMFLEYDTNQMIASLEETPMNIGNIIGLLSGVTLGNGHYRTLS